MIRNTDKRHAGDVPAGADGTFGNCCKSGILLLARRRLETAPNRINEARDAFYKEYADTIDLTGASLTKSKGNFGFPGFFKAGIDPIEQFVGSYRIDIYVIEENRLKFVLSNTASMESFKLLLET